MSVHHTDQRDQPFWNLAAFGHYDNPMDGFPPSLFGTPFGIIDGGYNFFRGYGGDEAAEAQFRARLGKVQERKTAGADMVATYQVGEDGNVLLDVTMYSETDIVLGAENEATLSAAVLLNKRHPYFSISAFHQASGALCSDLEPGGAIRCGIPMGKIEPEVLAENEVFVTLTYRPDPAKQSHDSVQSIIATDADAPEPVDEPPTVANGIADILVEMGDPDQQIDLSAVFTDPDDDDAAIVKTVTFNTNADLASASIEGNMLTLSFAPEMSGSAQITIQANSDGQTVDESFSVTVRDSSAPVYTIYLPITSRGHSFGEG